VPDLLTFARRELARMTWNQVIEVWRRCQRLRFRMLRLFVYPAFRCAVGVVCVGGETFQRRGQGAHAQRLARSVPALACPESLGVGRLEYGGLSCNGDKFLTRPALARVTVSPISDMVCRCPALARASVSPIDDNA
jgi:hypothetical protein